MHLTDVLPDQPGQPIPPHVLHLFWKSTSGISGLGVSRARCPSCQPAISVKALKVCQSYYTITTTTTTVLRPFFWDHPGEPVPGEPVPEENFWTLWCKGRLTEADTPTIRMGATPSGLTSAHLHHPLPIFLQAGCPSCRPNNSVKALKATSLQLSIQ